MIQQEAKIQQKVDKEMGISSNNDIFIAKSLVIVFY